MALYSHDVCIMDGDMPAIVCRGILATMMYRFCCCC